jgi:hypothetical protein
MENPEAAHMMMQMWDGRNALYGSQKRTLEGTIFWQLNPWTADYGHIKIYTGPLKLIDTGIVVEPDTRWHSFELVVNFANQRYVSIVVDGERRDVSEVPLATVHHPDWGSDVSFAITAESLASWPQGGCPYVFKWGMRYRDLRLSKMR